MRVYTKTKARFFPFRLRSEESVKSMIFFCRSHPPILSLQMFRRQQDRPGREMLQGKGGILKGGVAIGLGEVPRVIGFGKETEVG